MTDADWLSSFCRGFAATAGEKVFESLQVYAQSNGATVEEDQVVNADGVHHPA